MKANKLPAGWDESRVRRVRDHYENQAEDDAVGEDEAAYDKRTHSLIGVPIELVPAVRRLIAKRADRPRSRALQKGSSRPTGAKRKRSVRARASASRRRL